MKTQTLTVEGMTCEMCVKHVTTALEDLPGVQSAAVSLAEKKATVTYDVTEVQIDQMISAVAEEGYTATAS